MSTKPEQLEIVAMKAIFATYDHQKQVDIIRDFMDVARVDSIIRNNHPVMICGVDMTAPKDETPEQLEIRTYRNDFDAWVYQFLHGFCVVVEKDYLDNCFELFQMIVRLSRGCSAHLELSYDENYIGFYACDQLGYGESFDDENHRHRYCRMSIFTDKIEECVIFSTVGSSTSYLWKMAFDDLFLNFENRGEDVYIVLFLLGFFDHDKVMITNAIVRMKEHFFPQLEGDDLRASCFAISLYGGTKTDPTVMTRLHNMFHGLQVTPVEGQGD